MFTDLVLPGRMGSAQSTPEAPNRAGSSFVRASGFRPAVMGEIPKVRGMMANIALSYPATWPRRMPWYAIDGSPLTFWASSGDDGPWIEFDLSCPLRQRVAVTAVTVRWGEDYPDSYRIMGSNDGGYWKPVGGRKKARGGKEVIVFDQPLLLHSLRIEAYEAGSGSISVVEVEIFGDPEEDAPGELINISARAAGPQQVRLSWDQKEDETTYFYRVYRARGRPPSLSPQFLVETTCKRFVIDRGLAPGAEYHYLVAAESFGGRISRPGRASAATPPAQTWKRLKYMGVVEGFYNDPWPHQERLKMIAFMEDAGLNYYIYAPKTEPYHRQWWRKPYPEAEFDNFRELVACARAHNVTFNYALSPGLDMDMDDPAEVRALTEKLKGLFNAGVRAFTLALDDIPAAGSADGRLGRRQAALLNRVHAFLKGLDQDTELFFVPTVYSRTYSHWRGKNRKRAEYLEALAEIDPGVGIMWTGPGEVFSSEIRLEQAMELRELWDRPVLIWDNYPVNDVGLRWNIFTGPYLGRDLELGDAVGGIFLNPMYLPNASRVALFTAGRYQNQERYEPWEAYEEALRFVGGDDEGYRALKTVSDCLLPHPVFDALSLERTPVYQAVGRFWEARKKREGVEESARRLASLFRSFSENPEDLERALENKWLAAELAPASQKLSIYGQACILCLDLLAEQSPDLRVAKRRRIIDMQARARMIPWKVADETTSLGYGMLGFSSGRRSVMDDFIARALREPP